MVDPFGRSKERQEMLDRGFSDNLTQLPSNGHLCLLDKATAAVLCLLEATEMDAPQCFGRMAFITRLRKVTLEAEGRVAGGPSSFAIYSALSKTLC